MLSSRLKKLRHEKDILQKDVAEKLNISTSAYGFYEQGKRTPDLTILELLADYFNVSVDYLLGRTNDRNEIQTFKKKQDNPKDLDELIENFELYFMDATVSDVEKERIVREIQERYWKAKDINTKKQNLNK